MTLLEIGSNGYKKMLQTRKENFEYLKSKMEQCALKFDERLLQSPSNRISIGMVTLCLYNMLWILYFVFSPLNMISFILLFDFKFSNCSTFGLVCFINHTICYLSIFYY